MGSGEELAMSLGQLTKAEKTNLILDKLLESDTKQATSTAIRDIVVKAVNASSLKSNIAFDANNVKIGISGLPVLGPVPTDGIKPLFNAQHKTNGDAIFALACNYPKLYYQRFVGSLRKQGYDDDIVLAVSPIEKMKPGVKEYLVKTKVNMYYICLRSFFLIFKIVYWYLKRLFLTALMSIVSAKITVS
jgi:hypothetical protein